MRDWRAEREPDGDEGAPLDLGVHALVVEEPPTATPQSEWMWPALAITTSLGWIAAALWLAHRQLAVSGGAALVVFAGAVTSVPILIGVLWLLALRTSRAEARGFARTAALMRSEADSLERTVATLAAAIDTNRVKLAEQVGQLAAIGDAAAGRLQALSGQLAAEIGRGQAQADAIADAAHQAQATMGALIAAMPSARAETQEAAELLDRTGRTASEHADRLDERLATLSARAREADALAGGAAQRLSQHLAAMETTGDAAGARLEAVTGKMAAEVDALLGRTAAAVDGSRQGIAAQGEAMLAMVGQHQATLDQAARESADALAVRIASVEESIDRLARRLETQRVAGDGLVSGLEQGIATVEGRMEAMGRQGIERSQMLAASISALGGSADAMTEALKAGEALATRTIGTAESLLIALDAAAREIDETLPDALARLDERIEASRHVVGQSKPELLALVTAAESTHRAIEAIAEVIAGQRTALDQLSGTLLDTLTQGRAKADALGGVVDETVARAHRFAEDAAPRLVEALLRVRDTANSAATHARETLATVIPEAANALEAASAEAMRRAASRSVERQVSRLAEAADGAVAASAAAADRLGERLREITDNTALVEARLETARSEREDADRDSLARRVSLLIEALNSASIDITKTLAPDVSDSAWAAYLKGDRGVFTRRAVRLLDAGEAREIARLYDDQPPFREQVNRYIHDFEAMLRTVLAQRDGSPMGVTLLSSDMGKLYVALAQAIERLR